MNVVCHVTYCPYISKDGFCRKKLVSITQKGFCGHIYYNNGKVRNYWQEPVDDAASVYVEDWDQNK